MLTDAIIFVYILQVNISKVKNLRWLKNRQSARARTRSLSLSHILTSCSSVYSLCKCVSFYENKFCVCSFFPFIIRRTEYEQQWERTKYTWGANVKTGVSQTVTANEWEQEQEREKERESDALVCDRGRNTKTMQTLFALINAVFSVFQIEISILRTEYTVNRARIIV